MQRMAKFSVVIFISVIATGVVNAQPGKAERSATDTINQYFKQLQQQGATNSFTVREIDISGNKKTKESIILRELPFESGETYLLSELVKKFEVGRKQLLNTIFL